MLDCTYSLFIKITYILTSPLPQPLPHLFGAISQSYLRCSVPGCSPHFASNKTQLAWKIPWTEEPGRLQSMGSLRVGHDWETSLSLFTFMHWRRKWQPTPVFLPGESQGRGSLVGCCLWGRRVGHDWSDLAVAAAAATFFMRFLCKLITTIKIALKH